MGPEMAKETYNKAKETYDRGTSDPQRAYLLSSAAVRDVFVY
jgi:hypothetical protein